jgi:hypothetical protein
VHSLRRSPFSFWSDSFLYYLYILGAYIEKTPACITSSIVVWRHRARVNCGRSIATNDFTCHVSWQLLHCRVRALPSNGWCLQRHFLATPQYFRLWLSRDYIKSEDLWSYISEELYFFSLDLVTYRTVKTGWFILNFLVLWTWKLR